jgi:hypothetical protein
MRKLLVFIVALATFALIASAASAAPHQAWSRDTVAWLTL